MVRHKHVRGFLFACVILQSGIASAKWVGLSAQSPQSATTTLVSSDSHQTTVRVSIPGIEIAAVTEGTRKLSSLSIPGMSLMDVAGMPELPVMHYNIAVPFSTNPEVEITKIQWKHVESGVVAPSRGPFYRCTGHTPPLEFSTAYAGPGVFPAALPVAIAQEFVVRDMRGVNIAVHPVRYDFASGSIEVVTELEFTIRTPAVAGNLPSLNRLNRPMNEADFTEVYRAQFLNFNALVASHALLLADLAEIPKVVIISPENLVSTLAPFVQWKRQIGYTVNVATTESIGTGYKAIKGYIQTQFDTAHIGYVILVGDADRVAYHPGASGNAAGNEADPMYGLVAGDDSYPDLAVSRISITTQSDLENILSKTIAYEKDPEVGADWYQHATGIASNEGSPTDAERAEILRGMLLNAGFQSVDQFYAPNAKKSELVAALEDGRGFVNYIGHGSKMSWGTTGYSTSDIDQLNNGSRLPVIVSVACVNGDFSSGSDCFAERWLKTGTVDQPNGAVTIFASSTNQSWVPPTVGQKAITELVAARQVHSIGALFFNGSIAVLKDNSSTAKQTFETWHTFGDATLKLRSSMPLEIAVALPESIGQSEAELVFSVGEPYIWLGVSQDGESIGRGISNAEGNILLTLDRPLTDSDVEMTFTGFNSIPRQATLPVR